MRIALEQARLALLNSELPVGCVLVHAGTVVGATHNARYSLKSKIAHAEMRVIFEAQAFLYEHRGECDLYSTLEPCMMCLGAMVTSRVRRLIFGAKDYMAGATAFVTQAPHYAAYAPVIQGGVMAKEALHLLQQYTLQTQSTWAGKYFGLE